MANSLTDFTPARRNANAHTQRGLKALGQSIQTDGWIGAMTAAADGELIAGSARIETAADVFGTETAPIIIESDGTRPIIVKRTDIPQATDPRAIRLALADNRIQELDLSWDIDVLASLEEISLQDLWTADELSDLGQQWAKAKPSLDDLANTYGEPGERDFWPVIKVQVSPETLDKYNQVMALLPGEDEAEKFDALVSSWL